MVYLNYNNLDAETQLRLLSSSKEDMEHKFGKQLKTYAKEHHLDYDVLWMKKRHVTFTITNTFLISKALVPIKLIL